MFFRGKKRPAPDKIVYDPSAMSPAIRASICTGEQTAGFISRETGAFTGVMLINSPRTEKVLQRVRHQGRGYQNYLLNHISR